MITEFVNPNERRSQVLHIFLEETGSYTAIPRNGSMYYGLHRQFVIMRCMMKLITCHIELGL